MSFARSPGPRPESRSLLPIETSVKPAPGSASARPCPGFGKVTEVELDHAEGVLVGQVGERPGVRAEGERDHVAAGDEDRAGPARREPAGDVALEELVPPVLELIGEIEHSLAIGR